LMSCRVSFSWYVLFGYQWPVINCWQLSVVSYQWSVISNRWSIISYYSMIAIHCSLITICLLFTDYCLLLLSVHCSLITVHGFSRPFRCRNRIHLPGLVHQSGGDHRNIHNSTFFGDPLGMIRFQNFSLAKLMQYAQ
jgi:hypothetical protein